MQTDGKASHKNSTSEYLPLKHKIANLRNHNTISMKKALLTLLLATTTTLSNAYNPIVRNFSKDVYKGGTQTWDIAQGEGGCMYFANNNGVLEFNGREWTLMRLHNYTSVRSLYYDRNEHALYAGGTNELGRFCCSPSGVKYESLLDSLNVSLTEIWDISRDAAGDLVFEDKSARYILRSGGMERSGIERKETGEVFCTAENDYFRAEGTTSDGVYIRRKEDGQTYHLTTHNGLQNNTILSMYFDTSGGLWLGLDKGIDYVLLSAPFFRLFGDSDIFGTGYASVLYNGYLYLGTNIGVFRIASEKLPGAYTDADFERVEGLQGQVWNLQVLDGQLFCCHDKGIYIIEGSKVKQHIPLQGCWKLEPLDDAPAKLMLGSTYERFFVLEKTAETWHFGGYIRNFNESGKSFFRDIDSRIWFGHHVKGLYRLTLSPDGHEVMEAEHFGSAEGFPSDRSIYPGLYRGEIVFSTEGGFYRFDGKQAVPVYELNALFGENSRNSLMLFETPDRRIKYFWSGGVQAVEYPSRNGMRQLDSLSLRHLTGLRPLGFENTLSLGNGYILVNTEDGFDVIEAGNLREGKFRNEVFINEIRLPKEGRTVFSSRGSAKAAPLKLRYKENSLEFSFVEPAYTEDGSVEYSCCLRGYDKGFSPLDGAGRKEYSHLAPGHYTFTVRSYNRHFGEKYSAAEKEIYIAAPWFRSWWAVLVYILAGIGFLYCIYLTIRQFAERKAEKIAAQQAEEMQKAQMKREFEIKAEDLAASTMNLQRKNELLQKIGNEVDKSIEGLKDGEDKRYQLQRLRSLTELIRSNIEHDSDWKKFENNFDLVYSDFLKRLGAEYPQLSITDKKICAYLKMDLSSKEIAPLLGMTVRSVEMTRYRMRQKLGLSREDNLSDFLQKY